MNQLSWEMNRALPRDQSKRERGLLKIHEDKFRWGNEKGIGLRTDEHREEPPCRLALRDYKGALNEKKSSRERDAASGGRPQQSEGKKQFVLGARARGRKRYICSSGLENTSQ